LPELPTAVRELAGRNSRLGVTARQLLRAENGPAPERGKAAMQAASALAARAESD
jgi:hypothetical protein